MGFNVYPALAIRQPDFGRTLAIVAAMKTANFKNQLLRRKMEREDDIRGLTGEAVGEMFPSAEPSLAQGAPPPSAGAAMMASGGTAAPAPGGGAAPAPGGIGTPAASPVAPAGADVFQGRKVPPALIALGRVAPERALKIVQFLDAVEGRERDKIKRDNLKAGAMLAWFDNLPEEQQPLVWPQLRAQAEKEGLDLSNVPEQFDPRTFDLLFAQTVGIKEYVEMVERRERESTFTVQTAKGPYRFKPTRVVKNALALDLEPGTKEFKDYVRKSSGGVTPGQQANNREIDQARSLLEALSQELPPGVSLSEELHRRMSTRDPTTGRLVTDYNSYWGKIGWLAMQNKPGGDSDQARWSRILMMPPQFSDPAGPKALPPGVSAEEPGILDRVGDYLFGGDETPAPASGAGPRRGTPRAGGRGGPRGRRGAKAIPKMSLTEIDDLVNTKGKNLSPSELKAIQARLAELGK